MCCESKFERNMNEDGSHTHELSVNFNSLTDVTSQKTNNHTYHREYLISRANFNLQVDVMLLRIGDTR